MFLLPDLKREWFCWTPTSPNHHHPTPHHTKKTTKKMPHSHKLSQSFAFWSVTVAAESAATAAFEHLFTEMPVELQSVCRNCVSEMPRWTYRTSKRSAGFSNVLFLNNSSVRYERRRDGAGRMSHRFSKSVKTPPINSSVRSDVGGLSLIFFLWSPHHDTHFHLNHRFKVAFNSFHSVGGTADS